MPITTTEFQIEEAALVDGYIQADGRVLHGTLLRGTHFDKVVESNTVVHYNDSPLRIAKIMAYGRELSDLPEGMTGRLLIEGSANLRRGNVLCVS